MKKQTAVPRRIGTAELLVRLGVSRITVDRWVKAGRFPAPHYIGERRMWWLHEVEGWELAEAARPPEARRGAKNLSPAVPSDTAAA